MQAKCLKYVVYRHFKYHFTNKNKPSIPIQKEIATAPYPDPDRASSSADSGVFWPVMQRMMSDEIEI